MSTKYQKPLTIQEGFPALLKGFTREILRAQPDNIYEFGARYFANLLEQSKGAAQDTAEDVDGAVETSAAAPGTGLQRVRETAAALDLHSSSAAELEPIILSLFIEADADSSGYLDRAELANVLRASNLNLSDRQVRAVLAEADENEDNVVQYREFLPLMVEVLANIKAKHQAEAMMEQVDAVVRGEVENMLLHGMPKAELEALMLRVFRKADVDGSGQLSRHEFKNALKAAELGLTRRDINHILSQVDLDHNGLVSYQEFIPVCFQVLVERFKDEIVMNDILSNKDGLQGLLLESFQAVDLEGSGTLPPSVVKTVLKDLSYKTLGLSTLQLVTLLGHAPTTPDGLVQYVPFIPVASSMILSMYDVDSLKLRLQAIKEVAEAGGVAALSELNLVALRGTLQEAFQRADVEEKGQLTEPQVMQVLVELGTIAPDTVKLSDAHMRAMFAAIDMDESGTVDWTELVNFICDAIEHLEREQYINRFAAGSQQAPAEQEEEQLA